MQNLAYLQPISATRQNPSQACERLQQNFLVPTQCAVWERPRQAGLGVPARPLQGAQKTCATGLEEALPYKPDHSAVQLQVDLKKISQGFH
eukprot:2872606-Amphidinium_carterae.1